MFVVNGVAHASEKPKDVRIVSAKVTGHLVMLLEFSNGEWRVFDAEPLLRYPVYRTLADDDLFSRYAIDHGVLCWQGGDIDISPERAYDMSYQYDRTA